MLMKKYTLTRLIHLLGIIMAVNNSSYAQIISTVAGL
jgi:hypothetical protein